MSTECVGVPNTLIKKEPLKKSLWSINCFRMDVFLAVNSNKCEMTYLMNHTKCLFSVLQHLAIATKELHVYRMKLSQIFWKPTDQLQLRFTHFESVICPQVSKIKGPPLAVDMHSSNRHP